MYVATFLDAYTHINNEDTTDMVVYSGVLLFYSVCDITV